MFWKPTATGVAALALSVLPHLGLAAPIAFSGEIDLVLEDSGASDLSGLGVGTAISGTIDDATAAGSVTDGVGTVDFDCCIAAGGLSVTNDFGVDAEIAAALNSLLGSAVFTDGDVIDLIDLEGDTDSDGVAGRIEVGLSFAFDASTFADSDPSNYPFDPDDLLFTLFFLLQEDKAGAADVYSAIGLVDSLTLPFGDDDGGGGDGVGVVPVPAAGLLLLSAVGGMALVRRRRR